MQTLFKIDFNILYNTIKRKLKRNYFVSSNVIAWSTKLSTDLIKTKETDWKIIIKWVLLIVTLNLMSIRHFLLLLRFVLPPFKLNSNDLTFEYLDFVKMIHNRLVSTKIKSLKEVSRKTTKLLPFTLNSLSTRSFFTCSVSLFWVTINNIVYKFLSSEKCFLVNISKSRYVKVLRKPFVLLIAWENNSGINPTKNNC